MEENKNKKVELEEKELSVEESKAAQALREEQLSKQERDDVVISPTKVIWNNFKEKKNCVTWFRYICLYFSS